ncbi:hypothetical protein QP149_25480, partial [Escherichia coli]|nr:hypothetical protein [Escherichia coli]
MSLKDLANETLTNFNPATDKASSGESGLPEGIYDVVLSDARFHVYDSGYECVSIVLQAIGGDHDNEKEFINWNLDPEYVTKDKKTGKKYKLYERYPKLLSQNIKYVSQLAYVADVALSDADWEDMVTLGEALYQGKGAQFILEVTKSTSN